MRVQTFILNALPEGMLNREEEAYNTVPRALNDFFGHNQWYRQRMNKNDGSGRAPAYIFAGKGPSSNSS